MGSASYVQTSFLGGEWSAYYQGRMDNPRYLTAMNRCLNALPIEEGANTRRPGIRFVATTRNGAPGRVMTFNFTQSSPYNLEFTDEHLRLFAGTDLVKEGTVGVADITPDNPAVVLASSPVDWADGDQIEFEFATASSTSAAAILRNRQFVVNMLTTTTFTLADPLTGDLVDGADVGWDPLETTAQVSRIVDFDTPYTDALWPLVRIVQDQRVALLLQGQTKPQVIEAISSPSSDAFATFNFAPASFIDGPYMDPMKGASLLPSALTGTIELTITFQTWDDETAYAVDEYVTYLGTVYRSLVGANLDHTPSASSSYWYPVDNRFVSTDVGRSIRMFSQPEPWDSGTTYATGDKVTYKGGWYVAIDPPVMDPPLGPNEDQQPDVSINYWAFDPDGVVWTWGRIVAINSGTSIDVTILGDDLLYVEDIITFRLGLYSDTTGWPTGGCYHQGRFWLFGAQPNRIDGSKSNDTFNFSPTAPDGAVADDNAVSAVFNADKINTILWAMPNALGIVAGTQEGEWLIQASALSDPLTPTSIQAHKVSTFGSEFVQPLDTGMATVFIQRYGRKVMELLSDKYSSGSNFIGNNVSLEAKHLTAGTVQEIAYQEELFPCVWARTGEDKLIGCTYRRNVAQGNAPTSVTAWHRHELGTERLVKSIAAGPSVGGDTDSLFMVTADDSEDPVYWVEVMTQLFDEDGTLLQSWFLDGAITPSGATVNYVDDVAVSVTLYGLWYLNGQEVDVFAGGIDLTDGALVTVEDGQVTIPFTSTFTFAYLQELSASGEDFGGLAAFVDSVVTVVPPTDLNQTILGYLPNPGFGGSLVPDWDANRAYIIGDDKLAQLNLTTGAQYEQKTSAEIFVGVPDTPGVQEEAVIGDDGYIYTPIDVFNVSRLGRIDIDTLEGAGTFGVRSTGLFTEPYGIFGGARYMATVQAGTTFVLLAGQVSAPRLAIVQVDADGGMTLAAPFYNLTHQTAILCRGYQSPDNMTAVVYGVDVADYLTDPAVLNIYRISFNGAEAVNPWGALDEWDAGVTYAATDRVGLTVDNAVYKFGYQRVGGGTSLNQKPPENAAKWEALDNPGISITSPGSIAASEVDPTWTTFRSSAKGMVFDETDNTLIIHVSTANPVLVTSYIIKVRPADCSIVWKVPTPTGFSMVQGQKGRVRRGILGSFQSGSGSVKNVYRMDTSDGSVTTLTVNDTNMDLQTISNDELGVILSIYSYNKDADSPQPIYGTPDSLVSEWGQLYPGSFLLGNTTIDERITVPIVIGYSYTTQGQILRPVTMANTGARNGPGFAKTRRTHKFGTLLHNCVTQSISFGTRFERLFPGIFAYDDIDRKYTQLQLFSGTYVNTIRDDYSYDSMLCWEISRPFPATVLTIGGFIETQDD
tara:strand:+ start:7177 stop:11307 length:4131 start_codon:yes stop_codon:yes gene_type:complete